MKVLLDIKEDKAAFIIELLSHFQFVKAKPLSDYKAEVFSGIRTAVEEMKLIEEGKLKGTPARELLDEL